MKLTIVSTNCSHGSVCTALIPTSVFVAEYGIIVGCVEAHFDAAAVLVTKVGKVWGIVVAMLILNPHRWVDERTISPAAINGTVITVVVPCRRHLEGSKNRGIEIFSREKKNLRKRQGVSVGF